MLVSRFAKLLKKETVGWARREAPGQGGNSLFFQQFRKTPHTHIKSQNNIFLSILGWLWVGVCCLFLITPCPRMKAMTPRIKAVALGRSWVDPGSTPGRPKSTPGRPRVDPGSTPGRAGVDPRSTPTQAVFYTYFTAPKKYSCVCFLYSLYLSHWNLTRISLRTSMQQNLPNLVTTSNVGSGFLN